MSLIKKRTGFIFVIFLYTVMLIACLQQNIENFLSIHMIDVNQGDSILIITPTGKSILIDGGEPNEGNKVKAYLKKQKIKQLDLVVATHPHSDHIGGLIEIVDHFPIKKFIMPPKIHNTQVFEALLNKLKEKNIKISTISLNHTIDFDEYIFLDFFAPLQDYGEDLNLWSIVFKLSYKEKSFLFTGDIEKSGEEDLIQAYPPTLLRANVLKIGHHGSNTSTTENFLATVNPEIALISCGKENPYGHPHQEIIDRLSNQHVFIYRTDTQGSIILKSDGQKIWSHTAPINQTNNFQRLP